MPSKIPLMNLLLEVESVGCCIFEIHLCIVACVMSHEFTRKAVLKFLLAEFP